MYFLMQICGDIFDIFIFNVPKKLCSSSVSVKCILGKCQITGKEDLNIQGIFVF